MALSSRKGWTPYQAQAYNDCIKKVKKKTEWLAVIDIDEFIVPVTHGSLPKLLKKDEHAGGLQIFWQFFGTSNVFSIPNNKTLIETLVMKAPKDYGENYNFKTICQPSRVKEYLVHGAKYHKPYHGIFPHGATGGAMQPIHIDIVRIHHYWTRDEKCFREKKVPRRQRYEGNSYSEERIQSVCRTLNQEYDGTILRFVPKLKERLALE